MSELVSYRMGLAWFVALLLPSVSLVASILDGLLLEGVLSVSVLGFQLWMFDSLNGSEVSGSMFS